MKLTAVGKVLCRTISSSDYLSGKRGYKRIIHRSQMWRTMRITAFLLLVISLHVSAGGYSQSVNISASSAPLDKVLNQIADQTGYSIFWSDQLLAKAPAVTVNFKNLSLVQALNICLKNMPLIYEVKEQSRFVFIKPSAVAVVPLPPADLEGVVTDSAGKPIEGAYITLIGTSKRALTNSDGNFSMKDVPEAGKIQVSMIGYQSQVVAYSGGAMKVMMKKAVSELDAVTIVAYGTTTKRMTTGSIARVTGKEIANSPASNPVLSLEGRVAGVSITENSGVAGSAFTINIRGQNTISAGQLPLYIVDGVAFDGRSVEQAVGSYVSPPSIVGSAGFNPLNVLTPDMIESIEVLKDADATAIYGSRAANGVVVITTKKAKAGATRVSANIYTGESTASRTLPMLNAEQYIAMRTKAFENDGVTPTATNAPDLVSFASGWNTDMQKYFFNTGHFTDATVDISGGSAETQFLLSGTYRFEAPIFSGAFSDKVARVKMGIQHTSKDKRFKVNASANYASENNYLPVFNLWRIYNTPPNLPLYNDDGSLAWYTGYTNPVSNLINTVEQSNKDLLGNLSLSYQLMKGLSFKADAGYHQSNVENIQATFRKGSSTSATTGSAYYNQTNATLYSIEPQLNYTTKIGMGQLQALAGGTYQYNNAEKPIYYSGTFTSDALYKDPGSITITNKSSSFAERKYVSLFARLNYVWDNKYVINGNFRRDGSSAFAPGNRFGNFGSIGAAWIVSQEHFIKDNVQWLSFLKLRTSYGTVGNDQIPAYGYLSYYTSGISYGTGTTLTPLRLRNDNNYSWEMTKKFDIAADLGFFKDRILLTVNWYHNITDNMLLSSVPIASQTGFNGYTGNVKGLKVQNNGVEFELNTTNVQTKSFSWKSSFNITANKNKVVSFPGLASSSFATGYGLRNGYYQAFEIGQPIDLLYGYKFSGFDEKGVASVKDIDGDGVITPGLHANNKGDYVSLGTYDPKYYGGFSNTFSYKALTLDVLLQFVKKKNYNIYHGSVTPPGSNANQPADVLNMPFTYTATSSSAVYTSFVNYYALSDATVSDASYIRLKNISLSYSVPRQWLQTLHMQSGSIYVRAQNLLTITKYKGFDPENFGSVLPLYRMVMIGINTTL